MASSLERASLLFDQARYDEADKELRSYIANDPENIYAIGLHSLTLSFMGKAVPAVDAARRAIALAPDEGFCHYVMAKALLTDEDEASLKPALMAINESLRLESEEPDAYALKAIICMQLKRREEALEAAESGLAIDPEDEGCLNMRSMVLNEMGRFEESRETLSSNLSQNPDSAFAHANMGYSFLNQHRPKEAIKHFKEALRLEPDMEYARMGVVEALRARHFVYRMMFRYYRFMAGLPPKAQWGVIIGLFLLVKILRAVAIANPEMEQYVYPAIYLYIGFVYLSWAARPIFNFSLWLHPLGKFALDREEKTASLWVLLCWMAAAGFAVAGLTTKLGTGGLLAGFVCFLLVIPVTITCNTPSGRQRKLMTLATVAIGACGIIGMLFNPAFLVFFIIGMLAMSIRANISAT